MENEMTYDFGDDYITIKERYNGIYLYEENNDSELEFKVEDSEKVLNLLENLENYMEINDNNWVDLGIYEDEDEDGDSTGEYYWCDNIMSDDDINPYFSPYGSFYGNCIYRNGIQYIIEALREYIKPTSFEKIDKLTLKSILRLKRNLANEK